MTDAPITADDLKATLNTIEQALATAEAVNVDVIAGQLNVLYTAAEQRADEPAMLAISQTWDHVQLVAQQAEQSRQAALTAIDIAQTTQNQHLTTLKELEDLSRAVENMDSDNPLVNDLIESVVEASNEEAAMWYDENVEETIYSQLQDVFGYDDDYNSHSEIFLEIFRNNLEVLPQRKREFYAWLKAVEADNAAGDSTEDSDGHSMLFNKVMGSVIATSDDDWSDDDD